MPGARRSSPSTPSGTSPPSGSTATATRLKPGNSVGFRAGTGIAHGFLNNTQRDVRLLVVGEHEHADDRFTLFLAELRAHVAPDAHAIVALDGAGWHTARDPRWPGNVTPLPLPVF